MSLSRLKEEGFEYTAQWELPGEFLKPIAANWLSDRASGCVYAFVVGTEVRYVGKTERAVIYRMDQYRYRKDEHHTRLRDLIKGAIQANEEVEIYRHGVADKEERGAEEAQLIYELQPPWNIALKV